MRGQYRFGGRARTAADERLAASDGLACTARRYSELTGMVDIRQLVSEFLVAITPQRSWIKRRQ